MILTIKLISFIILCNTVFGQELYDYRSDILIGNNATNETDYDFDDDNNDQRCSADAIIEQFNSIILPDDYEEGKHNIKNRIESFNESLLASIRLEQYSHNVSEKMSELNKRIVNRLSEAMMTLDLPPECMTSLVRIMNGVNNGDLWALKCKCHIITTISFRSLL